MDTPSVTPNKVSRCPPVWVLRPGRRPCSFWSTYPPIFSPYLSIMILLHAGGFMKAGRGTEQHGGQLCISVSCLLRVSSSSYDMPVSPPPPTVILRPCVLFYFTPHHGVSFIINARARSLSRGGGIGYQTVSLSISYARARALSLHTHTLSLFDGETELEHGPAVVVLDRPRILFVPSTLLQRVGKLVLLASRNSA